MAWVFSKGSKKLQASSPTKRSGALCSRWRLVEVLQDLEIRLLLFSGHLDAMGFQHSHLAIGFRVSGFRGLGLRFSGGFWHTSRALKASGFRLSLSHKASKAPRGFSV